MDDYELNDSEINNGGSAEKNSSLQENAANQDGKADEQATDTYPETTENSDDEASEKPEEAAESQKNDIGSDIIRGHINTIILRALYDRDKYGYEIMNDIELKSHGQYTLKQPTLYSALKRLENQGYIKAYWKTDEVSNGGRRKYFTLTERGREITEKNLAEWEYSRTIIDSLISDRSFDFSQPAPTPVDFTLLRDSVSRVPVVRSDEAGRTAEPANSEEGAVNTQPQARQEQQTEQVNAEQHIIQQTQTVTQDTQTFTQQVMQEAVTEQQETVQSAQPAQDSEKPQISAAEEARRIAHENYLRLISTPVQQQPEPVHEDIVPNSENVNTDRLIYNNRPETERDYKNLIDGIFNRAISNGRVQTTYRMEQPKPTPSPEPPRRIRLVDRGRNDGVAVTTSNAYDSESTYATKTTYNKGLTFFKCSAIVLGVIAVIAIFCFIFQEQLQVNWAYPTVILALGVAQFAVFGIMLLKGYGKNCVRPTTNSYVSSCIILTIIAILIITALSFLFKINFTSASDVLKMIVIPSLVALNITLFAVCLKLFIR